MLAYNHLGLLGRLGNQMFQYAALRGIAARRGYDFGIPPSDFKNEVDGYGHVGRDLWHRSLYHFGQFYDRP